VLAQLLKRLEPGDQVVVTRLDRLARSTRDLLNILDRIGKAEASFRSLADAWADTSTAHGRLIVTVLGGLAEFERELIRARTGEGRARAKARGVHMGRPLKLNAHQRKEARDRRDRGETLTDIARTYGVLHMTIARAVEAPPID
jgi:DNA invertase Pin-like site-specific DNA recombinase